jgi:hypothetical protein
MLSMATNSRIEEIFTEMSRDKKKGQKKGGGEVAPALAASSAFLIAAS